METLHKIYFINAQSMAPLSDRSVDLVITSPPYPMIEMWDDIFGKIDPHIFHALKRNDGAQAFEGMHAQLDQVWREVDRVIKPGGIVCINIGDATRTLGDDFQLFANHTRIVSCFLSLGFMQLPAILWRKPTNSPNKFMGSGMLPPNAYVTLEHEYILIFRKKGLRRFATEKEKELRRASAYFWEERNIWFSDVWFGLIGATQKLNDSPARKRSGAYPFELAHRLIHMFSIKGDTVLDPFLGTGTTLRAAICAGRNSIGLEIDHQFKPLILEKLERLPEHSLQISRQRMAAHLRFVQERIASGKTIKHHNSFHDCPVITNQEKNLRLDVVCKFDDLGKNRFRTTLSPWEGQGMAVMDIRPPSIAAESSKKTDHQQLDLF